MHVNFMTTSDCPIGRSQCVAMLALVLLLLGSCLFGNLKQIITLELILVGPRSRRLWWQISSLQLFFGVARAIISECCTLALHPISLGKWSHPQTILKGLEISQNPSKNDASFLINIRDTPHKTKKTLTKRARADKEPFGSQQGEGLSHLPNIVPGTSYQPVVFQEQGSCS